MMKKWRGSTGAICPRRIHSSTTWARWVVTSRICWRCRRSRSCAPRRISLAKRRESAAWRREYSSLARDIGGDGVAWLALGYNMLEGAIPALDQPFDQGRVDAPLGWEVVVDVGLGQAAGLRDFLHTGAVEALLGEEIDGGVQDSLLVPGPDSRLRARRFPPLPASSSSCSSLASQGTPCVCPRRMQSRACSH